MHQPWWCVLQRSVGLEGCGWGRYEPDIIVILRVPVGDRSKFATYTYSATIGACERVYEPGQDRKIATVLHVSVMCFRSSCTIPVAPNLLYSLQRLRKVVDAHSHKTEYRIEACLFLRSESVLPSSCQKISPVSIRFCKWTGARNPYARQRSEARQSCACVSLYGTARGGKNFGISHPLEGY